MHGPAYGSRWETAKPEGAWANPPLAQGAPSGFAVSTKANTVTFARSWPERHVQVVLYTMPSVGHILAFADLDCALDGLEIAAQSFSLSILGGGASEPFLPCVLIRYKAKWGREGGFRRKHASSDFNANLGLHRHGSHRWSSVHDHSLSPRADTQDQLGTSVGNIKRGGTDDPCLPGGALGPAPTTAPWTALRVFPGAGEHAGGAARYTEESGELCEEGAHMRSSVGISGGASKFSNLRRKRKLARANMLDCRLRICRTQSL